jgi:hypothetical protein
MKRMSCRATTVWRKQRGWKSPPSEKETTLREMPCRRAAAEALVPARCRLRNQDVATLDRPLEDRPRMPLRCQRPSRWGRGRLEKPR